MNTKPPSAPTAPVLLVLAGPAGSGKSTLCDRLIAEDPRFSRVVTTTTRPMRPGEVNGIHYHFFTPAEFKARIERGEFLEWALVHGGHEDRMYGTLRSSVYEPLHHGRSLVMNIDVQGVATFRKEASVNPIIQRCMTTIFVLVDRERLRQRLIDRRQDTSDEIDRRMVTFDREVLEAETFDFRIRSTTRDADFSELCAIRDMALKKALAA